MNSVHCPALNPENQYLWLRDVTDEICSRDEQSGLGGWDRQGGQGPPVSASLGPDFMCPYMIMLMNLYALV